MTQAAGKEGAAGYRPPAGEPVRWPDAFGRRFIVFVDVEEEFDWRAPVDAAHRSTLSMRAFPAAHRRFADWGIGLTCMVDHPIASDAAAVAMLREAATDGRSAIGAQLHAWVTPPFDGTRGPLSSYQGNLDRAAEAAKIAELTEAIETAFGSRPLAFRAGRYGLGPATLGLLAAAGYRLDSSVRPGYDYRGDGGPDFRGATTGAYRADGMIELPLSTIHTGLLRAGGGRLHDWLGRVPGARGVAARLGLLQRVALTPEDMPLPATLHALETAAAAGERLLALSFHSPSLEPGHTPYVRNAADLAAFWRWWEAMIDRLHRHGYRAVSLAELLSAAG